MELHFFQKLSKTPQASIFQIVTFFLIVIFMMNLNALVDYFLHPQIPYFDKEHLIVGGITGGVSMILFGLLLTYMRHLNKAVQTIISLERVLPICSNCKKVRKTDSDPKQMDSWQSIDSYISERTSTKFSHGICPDCLAKYYSEFSEK